MLKNVENLKLLRTDRPTDLPTYRLTDYLLQQLSFSSSVVFVIIFGKSSFWRKKHVQHQLQLLQLGTESRCRYLF